MQNELVKTPWFASYTKPSRSGVYLTRSESAGNRILEWWRAFDGENWRAGILAVSPQGLTAATAPRYEEAVLSPVLGEHVFIQWCGIVNGLSAI
jgi:hypothetical protein